MNDIIRYITKHGFKQHHNLNHLFFYNEYKLYIYTSGYFLQQYEITIKTFTLLEQEMLKQYLKQIFRNEKLKNILNE